MGLVVDFGRLRVAISSACPLCGSSREDVYHFIVVCPQLVNVCSSFSILCHLSFYQILKFYWKFAGSLTHLLMYFTQFLCSLC